MTEETESAAGSPSKGKGRTQSEGESPAEENRYEDEAVPLSNEDEEKMPPP